MLLLSPTNSKQISPYVNLVNKEIQGNFDVTISELCSCSSVQYKNFYVFSEMAFTCNKNLEMSLL